MGVLRLEVLNQTEIEKIHRCTMAVLENAGFKVSDGQ